MAGWAMSVCDRECGWNEIREGKMESRGNRKAKRQEEVKMARKV